MSLLIRKACQPILDGVGLHEYHADMNSDKELCLKTNNCGKPFTTIPGVVFGRPHPTQAEIEYASELLETWVTRNENNIEAYLEKFFELEQTEEPDTKLQDGAVTIQMNQERSYNPNQGCWDYTPTAVHVYLGPTDTRQFVFNLEGELVDVNWDGAWTGNWANLIKLPAPIKKTALDFLQVHMDYRNLEKEVNRLAGELNLCKV